MVTLLVYAVLQADVNFSQVSMESITQFLMSVAPSFRIFSSVVSQITMALRNSCFAWRLLVLLLVTVNAWTPQARTKSSLIAASAALPVIQWASVSNALVESTPVVSSTTTVANADALQIPILAAYCTMAFWIIPKTVKKLKNNSYKDN